MDRLVGNNQPVTASGQEPPTRAGAAIRASTTSQRSCTTSGRPTSGATAARSRASRPSGSVSTGSQRTVGAKLGARWGTRATRSGSASSDQGR